MIKLFRKIRMQFLFETKLKKYLIYSIGEIILVVVGILIALQVNNWNQSRYNNNLVKEYLISMTVDIKSDILEFEQNISSYERQLKYQTRILQNKENKKLDTDSILYLIMGFWNLNRTSSQTYQKIKSTGLIETLGTPEIEKAVNDYYNISLSHYEYLINWDKELTERDGFFWYYNENFETGLLSRLKSSALPYQDSPEKRKAELIKLIESTLGRNYIKNAMARDEYGIKIVQDTKSKAENLVHLIEEKFGSW